MPGSDATHVLDTAEGRRLSDAEAGGWRRWGPYLSERQWGTVREDYSADGDAWSYLPHDHARSRAYRWSEDGIAGFSDAHQRWCLALALWNGRDPILKERMFGLTNSEGNHGEDVKELWYYLDGVPTHSYMRTLYKYPQATFPYADLLAENARRKGHDRPEYELVDTGVFAESRYFDVTTEYAKNGPDDILMRVTVVNRGPEAADLHVLPHLWARNTWSWDTGHPRPSLKLGPDGAVAADRLHAPAMRFAALQPVEWLFCENETNTRRLFGAEVSGFFKDGINDYVVGRDRNAVNPAHEGTKCAAHATLHVGPGATTVLRFRFGPADATPLDHEGFEAVFADRIDEADDFYAAIQRDIADPDARAVQRQAFAGMLWSKQYYHFDVRRWLAGDPSGPAPPPERKHGRDSDWRHLVNADIVSMPDKWEYPWYAAWDLAFHCVVLALIDPEFAKGQLVLLTREWHMHPNGQLPAYEWNFGDVNPPVHGLAAWRVYQIDLATTGKPDRDFLERVFHKLMLNFTWWVNRKDVEGRNIFQGGFLGLDNIGVFDRSKPLPTGGFISQADGTAWMAAYTLNLMQTALELAKADAVYEDIATKFFEHFLYIAEAMTDMGGEAAGEGATGLWDEQDQFYYDMLNLPDGTRVPLRVRSLVGLIPLCAVAVLDSDSTALPGLRRAPRMDAEEPARPGAARVALGRARQGQPAPAVAAAAPPHAGAAHPHAGRDRVPVRLRHPLGQQGPRGRSLRLRLGRHALRGRLRAGRINHDAVRRQFQLARSDLDADQRRADRGALRIREILRGRGFPDRMPQGIGHPDDDPASRGRAGAAVERHLPPRPGWPAPGARRRSPVPDRPGLPRPPAVPRIFQWRQRGRARRVTPDRVVGPGGAAAPAAATGRQQPRAGDARDGDDRAMSRPALLAAIFAVWPAMGDALAEPRLQDVLSAATLSFGDDGELDRAVLTQNGDAGADLTIFRAVPAPDGSAAALKPAVFKKAVVFSGQMWGTLPSLAVNGKGSLVIASANDAVGRDRWTQTLTVVLRGGAFVIAGITHTSRDTLDPEAGASSCDLNLLTGKGTSDGKPVTETLAPIPLPDWSDDKLPRACRG